MKVICYGDSNTYGYDPRMCSGGRYEKSWPDYLAEKTGWSVYNQGENGREIPKQPVRFPEDTDVLLIMLGTNDLLQLWSVSDAAVNMRRFLETLNLPPEKVLLLAPPPMIWGEWVQDEELIQDRTALAAEFRQVAENLGTGYLDPGEWAIPIGFDGVHITQKGHRIFADALIQNWSTP